MSTFSVQLNCIVLYWGIMYLKVESSMIHSTVTGCIDIVALIDNRGENDLNIKHTQ
jgi:hypothetical protein